MTTSADKIYIVEAREWEKSRVRIYSSALEQEYWLEPDLLHPLIKGGDSKRYWLMRTQRLILFPYAKQHDGKARLIPESELRSRYPLTWAYLLANRQYLENRENRRMRGPQWYGYIYPKALDVMPLPKLFTPDLAPRASFSLDDTGDIFFTGGAAGGYGLLVRADYSREYVLGLLNSRLLDWFNKQIATKFRGGWYSFESRFIRHLPIRVIDMNDPADRARHDEMVELVETLLRLHAQLATARTAHDKTLIQRQIEATDRRIDALVYALYGLTDAEIRLVEGQAP